MNTLQSFFIALAFLVLVIGVSEKSSASKQNTMKSYKTPREVIEARNKVIQCAKLIELEMKKVRSEK